jgi:tetratricopeptide (TPR) repeat protein
VWQFRSTPAADGPPPPAGGVRVKPSTAEEPFARGLEYLRTGALGPATADFELARRLRPDDGRTTAYLAYCRSKVPDHAGAAALYEEAVAVRGYDAAWAHCNWAYSLTRPGARSNQLRLAIAEATKALRQESNLRAARLNRASARYMLNVHPKARTLDDPECVADIEAVMSGEPRTADLCYKAAVILAASGREDQVTRAVGYLREAVRLGRPPAPLARDPVLRTHLSGRPDFQELTRLPPVEPGAPSPNLYLADPPVR